MTNTTTASETVTVTVGNGRAVHLAIAGMRAYTICGAEGRRVGGGHNIKQAPGRTVTCQRCDPNASGVHSAPKAPVQDRAAALLANAATADRYAADYRDMVAMATAQGRDTTDLEATLARHTARAAALRAEAAAC